MIITINGEKVDFSLDNEKNMGDVYTGVSSWLEESGMLIGAMRINNEPVPLFESAWKARSIDSVGEIDFGTVTIEQSRLIQMETARDYFSLLHESIESEDTHVYKELSAMYNELRSILPNFLSEKSCAGILSAMDETFSKVHFPENGEDFPPQRTVLSEKAREMSAILETLYKDSSVMETARNLAAVAETLEETALQFQTGRDKSAMESIANLMEGLDLLTSILSTWKDGRKAESIVHDLSGILGELEEALKAEDTVLIGDILEYELKSRLQDLPDKLLKITTGSPHS